MIESNVLGRYAQTQRKVSTWNMYDTLYMNGHKISSQTMSIFLDQQTPMVIERNVLSQKKRKKQIYEFTVCLFA